MIRRLINTTFTANKWLLGVQAQSHISPWRPLLNTFSSSTIKAMKSGDDLKNMHSGDVLQALRRQQKKEHKEQAEIFLDNLDETLTKTKTHIEFEYEMLLAKNEKVPKQISAVDWQVLLTECDTPLDRRKHMGYMYRQEILDERNQLNKIKSKEERKRKKQMKQCDEMFFTYCLPIYDREKCAKQITAARSITLGNPIVLDLEYETSSPKERKLVIQQLLMCYGLNMKHPEPFHIHVSGFKKIEDFNNFDDFTNYFASFYEGCFTDLFPKDRLVYLSPNGPMLTEYNGNDVYVIGGLVNRYNSDHKKESIAKAKKLGIRCGSFPIDKYFRAGHKGTSMEMNTVMETMLDVNLNRNWKEALWHNLPKNSLITADSKHNHDERKLKKRFEAIKETMIPVSKLNL